VIREFGIQVLAAMFLIFSMLIFSSYMRIQIILKALDRNLDDKPDRPHMQDKLRAYRDWCRDTGKIPVHLILFAIGAFGAVLCWTPLPWIIYH